ncbi:MAG: metallophosphoesterase [Firmicutes bacterium]|nr:metallophosphoesterase [Bacillota bacterium]
MRKRAVKPVVAAILGLLILFLYAGNNWIQVSRLQVKSGDLPQAFDGFKIVHIGDLHGKEFGPGNANLARMIKKQAPDLILTSGDMINSRNDDGGAFIALLNELDGVCPVYCSLGNHEQLVQDRDQNTGTTVFNSFEKSLRGAGGNLLDNQRVELSRNGDAIYIYGLTTALYHYTGGDTAYWEGADLKAEFLEDRLGPPAQDRYNILLAHNPKYFGVYRDWGAHLILAGHIHGGIIRLPYLGGVFSPDITFFPPYDAGLYRLGESQMYVTRGLGNSTIPFRLLNRPEVTIIELIRE